MEETVRLKIDGTAIEGILSIPPGSKKLILFSHGSSSSRFSPRNSFVAAQLHRKNMATLLIDLLSGEEDSVYSNRFNIGLLSERLAAVSEWLSGNEDTRGLELGIFGASTGAAAALAAAANMGPSIGAVVSRGGRPDLADSFLPEVRSPTLLIVGSRDAEVLKLNEAAYAELGAVDKKMEIVEGATHLFEEPGALEEVSRLAAGWFRRYL